MASMFALVVQITERRFKLCNALDARTRYSLSDVIYSILASAIAIRSAHNGGRAVLEASALRYRLARSRSATYRVACRMSILLSDSHASLHSLCCSTRLTGWAFHLTHIMRRCSSQAFAPSCHGRKICTVSPVRRVEPPFS